MIMQEWKHEPMTRDLNLKSMIFNILKNNDNLVSTSDLKMFL